MTEAERRREAWIRRQLAAAPKPSPALIASLNALRRSPDVVTHTPVIHDQQN